MGHDAFVLAAGLGTRLRPLTLARPKPLVPVCGVPMLAYALAAAGRHGLRDVVVNAHHFADQVEAWAGRREGVSVRVVVEPTLLGTGGGLRAVWRDLAPRVAVINADVLQDVALTALVAAVPEGGGAMALRPHARDAARYGVVAADASGVIARLSNVVSAPPQGALREDTHFTGIHALHRDAVALVPPDGEQCIVRTAYRALVPRRLARGVLHPGTWLDVGDPAAYLAANLALLTTTLPVPLDPVARAAWARTARGARGEVSGHVQVDGACWVGPGANLGAGVRLRDAVVGDGAVVAAGASLTRCVVWDGARVPAGDHVDAVFFDHGVLQVAPEVGA